MGERKGICVNINQSLGTFLLKSPDVFSITEAALEQGYRLIDTAAVYKNESAIGEVLRKVNSKNILRSDVFITSKLGPAYQGTEKAAVAASLSLEALQLSHLDLYLIHWPGSSGMKPDNPLNAELRKQTWLQLEILYNEGKFKAIGISNYTIAHIQELLQYCSVVPAVLQIEVHPYLTQTAIRKFCVDNGIHVQAYSSIGSKSGCSELLSDSTVMEIAEHHGKTPAQVLLRWAIEHGMSVIPKTSNLGRLKENMNIFDFSLSSAEVQRLDNLNRDEHFCWNPKGVK
ncbi:glyoxal reductase-like [Uloborus diversus]|uniref:glyoxal reductase-like n=1 Tax=Uloborus diversus TaxID=327109 RepID=UPI00240A7C97|nr:glyoxal reductase-like [Uloborus diversus]